MRRLTRLIGLLAATALAAPFFVLLDKAAFVLLTTGSVPLDAFASRDAQVFGIAAMPLMLIVLVVAVRIGRRPASREERQVADALPLLEEVRDAFEDFEKYNMSQNDLKREVNALTDTVDRFSAALGSRHDHLDGLEAELKALRATLATGAVVLRDGRIPYDLPTFEECEDIDEDKRSALEEFVYQYGDGDSNERADWRKDLKKALLEEKERLLANLPKPVPAAAPPSTCRWPGFPMNDAQPKPIYVPVTAESGSILIVPDKEKIAQSWPASGMLLSAADFRNQVGISLNQTAPTVPASDVMPNERKAPPGSFRYPRDGVHLAVDASEKEI